MENVILVLLGFVLGIGLGFYLGAVKRNKKKSDATGGGGVNSDVEDSTEHQTT